MIIEKHVVNLELSKRLKELGVKQESEFYWIDREGYFIALNEPFFSCDIKICSAFLSSELGELLPIRLPYAGHGYSNILITKGPTNWTVRYMAEYFFPHRNKAYCQALQFDKTESDARAKMLIYLIENKILTPQKGEKM